MDKVIKIFDPKDRPFGWLSNNYKHLMRIEGQVWNTVTNYIYANILNTPMFKQSIRLAQTHEVQKLFQQLYQQEINTIVNDAIIKGLQAKLHKDELAQLLIATGDAPIYYISPNPLLGIGPNGQDGLNEYGKSLMQMRHILRVSFRQKKEELAQAEKDQLVYDLYMANKGLTDAIQNGDDLKDYMNKSPAEIVDRLGRDKLKKIVPSREIILEMAHRGNIPEILKLINHPENLLLEVRKKEMKKLRLRRLKERKEIIFDMYADYLLEKHFDIEQDQYSIAKQQQFEDMGWQQKNDLENRLYELFNRGMLSERLSDAIDQRLASLHIPTEEEVAEVENIIIPYEDKPLVDNTPYVPANGPPILVYPTDFPELDEQYKPYVEFSPIALSGMLKIDNYLFPTIAHYITARLMAHIPAEKSGTGIGGMKNAYPYILFIAPGEPITGVESFVDPDLANERYEQLRDANYQENLRKYAKIALNKKFEDRVLQDLLLMTGKATLIWSDFNDAILGSGPRDIRGENFVGKYLMQLREKIIKEREGDTLKLLHTGHVTMVLNEDAFMKDWVDMRIRDMCKVISTMKSYIYTKDEIDVKLDATFAKNVLDKVYQPCSHIFAAAEEVDAPVPEYFRITVISCPGFGKVIPEVVDVIWKRIVVMIYYLIKHLEQSNTQNLKIVLSRIEMMVSKGSKCEYIVPNDYDNCIISALINLLRGISEFNKQHAYNNKISELDIKTAASIILNSDVSEDIKPVVMQQNAPPVEWGDTDVVKTPPIPPVNIVTPGPDSPDKIEDQYVFPDDEREQGGDYGDDDWGDLDREIDDAYSPNKNMIVAVLKEIDEIEDHNKIAEYIEGAVEIIKTYPMSKLIKRNRINFFASQR